MDRTTITNATDGGLMPPPDSEERVAGATTVARDQGYDDRDGWADHERGERARENPRTDRVRWPGIWAGLVTAVATFVLLQLTWFATDAVGFGLTPDDPVDALPVLTAVAAGVAFLLGGIVAGASAMWDRADDGLLQGIVMWALGIVALLLLTVVGAGVLTSAIGGFFDRVDLLGATNAAGNGSVDGNAGVDDAQDAAAAAVAFLGITFAASAIGGLLGSKMWPRKRSIDLRDRDRSLTRTR